MLASYFLSNTLVPVLSVWLLRDQHSRNRTDSFFDRMQTTLRATDESRDGGCAGRCSPCIRADGGRGHLPDRPQSRHWTFSRTWTRGCSSCGCARRPARASSAPKSWRSKRWKRSAKKRAPDNVEITLGFVGTQPASYPVNTIHLWTSGPQEAVLRSSSCSDGSGIRVEEFKERLRGKLPEAIAGRGAFVRSRRHRQPGDELRRADADRGGGERPESGRQPRLRRQGARRDEEDLVPCAICNSASRSITRPSTSTLTASAPGSSGVTVEQIGRSLVAATSSSASLSRTIGATRRAAWLTRCRSKSRSRVSPRSKTCRRFP